MYLLRTLLPAFHFCTSVIAADLPDHLKDGLKLYYDFEASAPQAVVDRSGNPHPVTKVSADVQLLEGITGKAAAFKGGAGMEIGNSQDLGFDTPSFAVSFWLRSDQAFGDQQQQAFYVNKSNWDRARGWIVLSDRPHNDALMLRIQYGSKNRSSDLLWDKQKQRALPAGEWVHILAQSRGSVMKFYVNGVLCESRNGRRVKASDLPLVIGEQVHGRIDELMLWDRHLEEGEIRDIMRITGGGNGPAAPAKIPVAIGDIRATRSLPIDFRSGHLLESLETRDGSRFIQISLDAPESFLAKHGTVRVLLRDDNGAKLPYLGGLTQSGKRLSLGGGRLPDPKVFVVPDGLRKGLLTVDGEVLEVTFPEPLSSPPMSEHVLGVKVQVGKIRRVEQATLREQDWRTELGATTADLVEVPYTTEPREGLSTKDFSTSSLYATADGLPTARLEKQYRMQARHFVVPAGAKTLALYYRERKLSEHTIGPAHGPLLKLSNGQGLNRDPKEKLQAKVLGVKRVRGISKSLRKNDAELLETRSHVTGDLLEVKLALARPADAATYMYANTLFLRLNGVPIPPERMQQRIRFENGRGEVTLYFPCGKSRGKAELLVLGKPAAIIPLP